MESISELLEQADSLIETLDKDYEAMSLHRGEITDKHREIYFDLMEDAGNILESYAPELYKFMQKAGTTYDAQGTSQIIYQDEAEDFEIVFVPCIYWIDKHPNFQMAVRKRRIKFKGYVESVYLYAHETEPCADYNSFKDHAQLLELFLNHCPNREQLKVAFESALTVYIKEIMSFIQRRNEQLAKEIQEANK